MRITDVSVVPQRRRRADVHRALVLSVTVTVQAIGMWAKALLFLSGPINNALASRRPRLLSD
jgi:hypothetical protein